MTHWFLVKFTPLNRNGFWPLNLSLNICTCQNSLICECYNRFNNSILYWNQERLKNQNFIYQSIISHSFTIFILTSLRRTTYIISTPFAYICWLKKGLYSLILPVNSIVRKSPIHHYLLWMVEVLTRSQEWCITYKDAHNVNQMVRSRYMTRNKDFEINQQLIAH